MQVHADSVDLGNADVTPCLALESPPKSNAPEAPGGQAVETPQSTPKLNQRALKCRTCARTIAYPRDLTPIQSQETERVFSNPYGQLFEVLTSARADNLKVVGPPSTEFAWFSGYAWEIAYCTGCGNHMGWAFGATAELQPENFWGLLKRELVEG